MPTFTPAAPLPTGDIDVSLSDRWMVAGTTGSGKTTFVHKLIAEMRRNFPQASDGRGRVWPVSHYVLDSKGLGDFDHYPGVIESRTAPDPLREPGGTQVWIPPTNDPDEYATWLTRIFEHKRPALITIDELSSVAPNVNATPDALTVLLKQGRKGNMGAVIGTQEACYIPRQILGMATHLVRFTLQNKEDAAKVDRACGRSHLKWPDGEPRNKHGFLYCRLDRLPRAATEYSDLSDFF